MTKSYALRPDWTPLNIGLMILGFLAFWPLGLAMLAYILWGDRLPTLVDDLKSNFSSASKPFEASYSMNGTGNQAFDDYRSRELKRLEEERRKLERERSEFDDYVRNLRRARDQEEFDRFMSERNDRAETGTDPRAS